MKVGNRKKRQKKVIKSEINLGHYLLVKVKRPFFDEEMRKKSKTTQKLGG
jgi:hypothetical protein